MDSIIKNAALEIIKSDFMQYLDFDDNLEFSTVDAITVILSQSLPEICSSEIYDYVNNLINKK